MADHHTHKLDAYHDDRVLVPFCRVCSAEGDFLAEPCPGKFIPNRDKKLDSVKELR